MRETDNIFKSKPILKIFLSVFSGKETEPEIRRDVGFKQPTNRMYLNQLTKKKLIMKTKSPERELRSALYKYNINEESFKELITKYQGFWIEDKKILEVLKPLFKDYLKIAYECRNYKSEHDEVVIVKHNNKIIRSISKYLFLPKYDYNFNGISKNFISFLAWKMKHEKFKRGTKKIINNFIYGFVIVLDKSPKRRREWKKISKSFLFK